MSRNPFSSDLYRLSSLLSQQVSNKFPIFKEIALMNVDERVSFAVLYVITKEKILEKDLENMTIEEMIEKILMPLLQDIGYAKFRADVLTHLGWKIGNVKDQMTY